ncbi:magnesium/cobalt transporter CorA [Candidatus Peregrinibacteria bacterium]|nr:magnesium/cobalt transporter CorA [Candidatus Peregrinibacteria bacterium]
MPPNPPLTAQSSKKGLPPGTLVHIGRRKREKTTATVIDYSAEKCEERELPSAADAAKYKSDSTVSWINVIGLHDTESIASMGKTFDLHPLLLEDIVNSTQRPKLQEFDACLFVTVRLFYFDVKSASLESEQVSLVLGKGYVLSFQEDARDVFDPVRAAIRQGKGKLRGAGADFLLYQLLDVLIDSYFDVLENIGYAIESLEEDLLKRPAPSVLSRIHKLRREMIIIRKAVWPLREVLSAMDRLDNAFIEKKTHLYLRDAYDHTIQLMDNVETFRDMLAVMVDQYLSLASNRMNEVMKVLTVIATIFMPLTFLVGVYGMNFDFMPELSSPYGYPAVWAVCILIAAGMVVYFRKKEWL